MILVEEGREEAIVILVNNLRELFNLSETTFLFQRGRFLILFILQHHQLCKHLHKINKIVQNTPYSRLYTTAVIYNVSKQASTILICVYLRIRMRLAIPSQE